MAELFVAPLCPYHTRVHEYRKAPKPLDARKNSSGGRLAPGDFVVHPQCPEWGIGQVQSVDGHRVTVNFENAGKQLINTAVIMLERTDPTHER